MIGLSYLHKVPVIHRDMKAANILVTETGKVMICDLILFYTALGQGTVIGNLILYGIVPFRSTKIWMLMRDRVQVRGYVINLPSSLRLLFAESLPDQKDDYRPLALQALPIPSDTQDISSADDITHAPFPSEPIVRARTRMVNDTNEVAPLSSHGIFLAEGSLGPTKSAIAQSPKIVGESLVDNGPKDDLAFQFPVNPKQALPRQSTFRVTQNQASPMPRTTVNHPNTHRNALSL